MDDIKRWYDKSAKLSELMDVLSNLADSDIDKIAQPLYQIVRIYWKQKREKEELVSMGADKLFGYYKAYNKRRWYDRNPSLSSAVNIMSTLSVKDLDEIVDGFLYALRSEGLYSIYSDKKKEMLEEKEST